MTHKYLIIIFSILLVSCNSKKISNEKLFKEINNRISILDNSYKFKVIPANYDTSLFHEFKKYVFELNNSNQSYNEMNNKYSKIRNVFLQYGVEITLEFENLEEALFNILIGIDQLIFNYTSPKISFSNYRILSVPEWQKTSTGDSLNLKLYLTSYDTLYSPEYKVLHFNKEYNMLVDSGVAHVIYSNVNKKTFNASGFALFRNELGTVDTFAWSYSFLDK